MINAIASDTIIDQAYGLAEAKGTEAIYLGINAIDYSGYPDCRPEYLEAVQHFATLSSKAAGSEIVRLLIVLANLLIYANDATRVQQNQGRQRILEILQWSLH